jgi:hypothetical protein
MSILSSVANFHVPIEFVLFGLTLLGVAIFHRHTLGVSLVGLAAIALYKLFFTGFRFGPGVSGLSESFAHEWVILANLLGLLTGFALFGRLFREQSSAGGAAEIFAAQLERRVCTARIGLGPLKFSR